MINLANTRLFNDIIQSLVVYGNDNNEPQVQKVAFSVLIKMSIAWGGGVDITGKKKNDSIRKIAEFETFVKTTVLGMLIKIARSLKIEDSTSTSVLQEIANFHLVLLRGLGQEYLDLAGACLGTNGYDNSTIEEFKVVLKKNDAKSLKVFLISLIK